MKYIFENKGKWPQQINEKRLLKKGDRVRVHGQTGTIQQVDWVDPAMTRKIFKVLLDDTKKIEVFKDHEVKAESEDARQQIADIEVELYEGGLLDDEDLIKEDKRSLVPLIATTLNHIKGLRTADTRADESDGYTLYIPIASGSNITAIKEQAIKRLKGLKFTGTLKSDGYSLIIKLQRR